MTIASGVHDPVADRGSATGVAAERASVRFSVIIPLYNKARHVARALGSVARQSLQPVEVIVIDDSSTDGGLDIVRSSGISHIIERKRPGAGGYAARNAGIAAATAEWMAFLDADDEWFPDHLERLAALIDGATIDTTIAAAGFEEHYPGGRIVADLYSRHHAGKPCQGYEYDDFIRLWLKLGECPIRTSATAARRTSLEAAGLFPENRCSRGGDKDMWLRLARLGPVIITPARTAIYHKDSDNMVTGAPYIDGPPCIAESIDAQIQDSGIRTRGLLLRLRNHETYLYALRTVKTSRLRRAAWRGFAVRQNPARFVMLCLLSTPLAIPLVRVGRWFRPK